jgi:deoxyribonucleoside regulator
VSAVPEKSPRAEQPSHEELMLRAAELYYEADQTQEEIARKLHVTRWKVGRLLAEARQTGLVRIEIVHPRARQHSIERALCDRFLLRAAVVVPGPEADDETAVRAVVGKAAAVFLSDLRPTPKVLGLSWGRTLDEVARHIPPSWATGVHIVQVNGSMSRSSRRNTAPDIAGRIASAGGGTVTLLPAPAIVEREAARRVLESEPSVARTLALAGRADAVLFSLGALSEDSVLVESGYLSPADVAALAERGAVGDALARFIRADGTIADAALDRRTLGLELADLRRITTRIAVAGGQSKQTVISAALSSGLCNVLVTDGVTARGLLEAA